ncbi:MAG TPA: hypothetical protein VKC61_10715 [Pyrinomonadaceae bacterium]|nr:hypothetical protein [Pyrinomonadaceae bacterium]
MDSLSWLKTERSELQAKYNRLKASPHTPEVAQERATTSELLRQWDTKILIHKAALWGIEGPRDEDWYVQETNAPIRILTPYLNDSAVAILAHRIKVARFAYWKGWAEILITVLSLLVAILALLRL